MKYKDIIKGLDLFNGLSEEELNSIFSNSIVKNYQKDEIVFLQEQPIQHFFILLNGEIRLFKTNKEGKELTTYIATKCSPYLHLVTTLRDYYEDTATTLNKVTLLLIPIVNFDRLNKDSNKMQVNLTSIIAHRYREAVEHIEQLTLKNVNERIGWFILKLYLKNIKQDEVLKLPYEKSLIANYLNMKAETFSRALLFLKNYGIKTIKGNIILSDKFSLCSFCTCNLAKICKYRKQRNCQYY